MPDAPGRGLSHISQASAPNSLSYVQLGQDHAPAAQKSCSSATLQTHRTMQTTVSWDVAAYYAQEERAATPGECLAVRGQAACNPARLRTAGASAGTRKFAGHIGRWKLAAGEKARHRGPAGMKG